MLKKESKTVIISSEMGWNLMNQNVLISTAMISALWDTRKNDTLDIMLPFLKYAIAKTTTVGSRLDINAIIDTFKEEFGYNTVPYNVIITMLNRLSPTFLSKKDRVYVLVLSLDEEFASFEKKRTIYKEQRNEVGLALANHLNKSTLSPYKAYDTESALLALISFFSSNGLIIVQTPELLSLIKKDKDGKLNYSIGRFLVKEYENQSAIFDYITNMVKGFFVSAAISFQPENLSLPHSKFKNLQCYLDTRVILSALGLRLPAAKTAAIELLEMMQNEQATICCFEHTINEIKDIIRAYRNSLFNPSSEEVHNTLEYFDEQHYSVEQVSRYLSIVEKKIESLGIRIVRSPSLINKRIKGIYSEKFKNQLKNEVRYNSESAWWNDVLSVLGVMLLREGRSSPELEKCSHIFVTTNIPLIEVVNDCLWDSSAGVGPVITDTTLSSIVWFKSGSSHSNYPAHKLIENAMLALEPSHSFLKVFFDVVSQFRAEGGISEEEAAIIRTDISIKRELISKVNGDSSTITKDTINSLREDLRNRYVGETQKVSEENYQLYLAQKARNDKALLQIIKDVEDAGERKKEFTTNIMTGFIYGLLGTLFLAFIIFTAKGFAVDHNYWIGSVITLIINIIGLYDLLKGRKQLIKSAISRISDLFAEKAREKRREEYSDFIEAFTDE